MNPNPKFLFPFVLCVLWFQVAPDVAYGQAAQLPVAVGVAVEIPGVVAAGTPIERIQTGYEGLDDPIGITDGSLLFSDPGARRIHRLDPNTNEVSVLVAESNESHGVTEDSTGRLISAQAWDGSTRIGVIYPPDRVAVLADSYDGQPFSRPNDLIVAKSGGVYFTDPGLTAGQAEALVERNGGPLEPRLPAAVYYVPPGGQPVRIEENMIRPNGIQLSSDERTLYVSDSNGEHVIAWDIQPDGLVANRRDFGTLQGRSMRDNGLGGVKTYGDGMAIDNDGRLYVATGGGIEVLSPSGAHLGTIPVKCPPRDCQNVAFGGPDKRTLYIAGAGSLYRVAMTARGFAGRAK
ncbi:MAG: SMP-30/gluconolactonase/LRE family protein [Acidobacteria bacterium]|nr:SMP-30/gluconolactonase/LRE family protein [Acidobacteriota bacterium]